MGFGEEKRECCLNFTVVVRWLIIKSSLFYVGVGINAIPSPIVNTPLSLSKSIISNPLCKPKTVLGVDSILIGLIFLLKLKFKPKLLFDFVSVRFLSHLIFTYLLTLFCSRYMEYFIKIKKTSFAYLCNSSRQHCLLCESKQSFPTQLITPLVLDFAYVTHQNSKESRILSHSNLPPLQLLLFECHD